MTDHNKHTACFRYLQMFPFLQMTWIKCTGATRSHIGTPCPGLVDRHKVLWRGMETLLELKPQLPFPINLQVAFSLFGCQSCGKLSPVIFCMFSVDGLLSVSLVLAGFNHQPITQQLHMQDRYKEDLKQQVSPGPQPSLYVGNCWMLMKGMNQTKHEML